MKHRVWIPLLAALVLAAPTAPARAQVATGDRVQAALELTDQRIQQAQALLGSRTDGAAGFEVDAGVRLQGQARDAYAAQQLELAMRLTLDARGHADRAIALLRNLPDPDEVTAQIENTHAMVDRARDRLADCELDRARALLNVAEHMADRADDAARAGRYLAALQLALGARDRARQAMRLCQVQDTLDDGVERALQRTDAVLDRARARVTAGSPELGRRALDRAADAQGSAWREYKAGHLMPALRLTQLARALALRSLRLSQAGS